MATTTNYSWTTPDDTDLVKDGAAAIRTLGSSADTTVKDLNPGTTAGDIDYYTSSTAKARVAIGTAGQVLKVNAGGTAPEWGTTADQTPLTTKGDLFTFDTADARLGVGADGTVLTADSNEATGLIWSSPSAAKNFTLLNSGGTALSGANTITVSGISGIDQLFISIQSADSSGTSEKWGIQLNGVTSGYVNVANDLEWGSTYNAGNYQTSTGAATLYITLGKWSGSSGSLSSGGIMINGCATAGLKTYMGFGGGRPDGNSGHKAIVTGNIVNTTAITSVSAYAAGGTFTGGTMFIYGAA